MSTYRIPVVACRLARERTLTVEEAPYIRAAADAARLFHDYLADADREQFVVLLLNTRHRVVGVHTVSVGGLNSVPVHPREVFKPALINDPPAAAILLGHNHPSGDPTPSRDDALITEQLLAAGRLLDIQVLDHVITTPAGRWVSLREQRVGFS